MKGFFCVLPTVILCASLVGCTAERQDVKKAPRDGEVVVLQERNENYPRPDYAQLRAEKNAATRASVSSADLEGFIGYSYKATEYPLENAQNIGFQVIDMDRYLEDNPDRYRAVPLKQCNTDYVAFRGFSRYETNMEISSKVNSSLNIDWNLFGFGAKVNYEDVFSKDISSSTSADKSDVYGEVRIKFYDTECELAMTSRMKEDIKNNYLRPSFVENLHYSTPCEFLDMYGGFVLTSFVSGGQAIAVYNGRYKGSSSTSDVTVEEEFRTTMEASVELGQISASGSYSTATIGTKQDGSGNTDNFSNMKFSLRTLGGLPAYSQFTVPTAIDGISFDISAWSSSLGEASNLTIAELPDDALLPIIDFIDEENLKELYTNYYQEGLSSAFLDEFIEPFIAIQVNLDWDYGVLVANAYLVNRFGDYILCESYNIENVNEALTAVENSVKAKYPNLRIEEQYRSRSAMQTVAATTGNECQFDIENMRKFIDEDTDKMYLLREMSNGEKYAYTIYEDILSDYTFEDAVDDMPVADNVTLDDIRDDYHMIAL